ncbi:MAG: glutathione-dependent disulfide-bond oxidoreductase [Woeseia sp.]|nr:glutathione-dependent disulfide-bond oxidoreductase [Woeseia sp.]
MIYETAYTPAKVWKWEKENGGKWAGLNRPVAGATHEQPLPTGRHPLQIYSLATPNGVKVTVMLEELLALGHEAAEYDAHLIKIDDGDQFGSGFVEVNPNSKIPAMMDNSTIPPTRIFESSAILFYLAEKFDALIPKDPNKRAECLSWFFWQAGSAPFLGGGFGHFYQYAPAKFEYPIDRYTMEVKRQLDVLDRHLAINEYLCGDEYSIADVATWPWYGMVALGLAYDAAEFLDVKTYTHVIRWAEQIQARDAVKRGQMVNRTSGPPEAQLHERHDAADFSTNTEDKKADN